jgi:hypothetical protein
MKNSDPMNPFYFLGVLLIQTLIVIVLSSCKSAKTSPCDAYGDLKCEGKKTTK